MAMNSEVRNFSYHIHLIYLNEKKKSDANDMVNTACPDPKSFTPPSHYELRF